MQTQITCPSCGTHFATQVYNIVDAQRTPELKQMLLAGALNVASCQNCGMSTQLAVPIAFHDAQHQLFMTYVPMELNLPLPDQERLVGQMTKAITEGIPQEQFRAYLLQPQTVLTMQTFMEKVYGTEGITPEMLAQQRKQSQFLQQLMSTDSAALKELVQNNIDMVDETLFAMLGANLQNVEQSQAPQANEIFVQLTNLQAWLYTHTEVGRQLEKQQIALRAFQQAVQKQGGLTFEILIDHLLANIDNQSVVDAIIQMGQQGIRYELFTHLTEQIEKTEDAALKAKMENLREQLLRVYDELQAQAKEQITAAQETLTLLSQAADLDEALKVNAQKVDENFLYFLSAQIQQAESQEDSARLFELKRIQQSIMAEAEKQMPPELRFINQLISTDDLMEQQQMIDQIPAEERPQMAALLQIMGAEIVQSNPGLQDRIDELQKLLST